MLFIEDGDPCGVYPHGLGGGADGQVGVGAVLLQVGGEPLNIGGLSGGAVILLSPQNFGADSPQNAGHVPDAAAGGQIEDIIVLQRVRWRSTECGKPPQEGVYNVIYQHTEGEQG